MGVERIKSMVYNINRLFKNILKTLISHFFKIVNAKILKLCYNSIVTRQLSKDTFLQGTYCRIFGRWENVFYDIDNIEKILNH